MRFMASRQQKAPFALQAETDHRKSSEPHTVVFGQPSSTTPPGPESAEEREAISSQAPSSPQVQGKVAWSLLPHLWKTLTGCKQVPGLWPGPALRPRGQVYRRTQGSYNWKPLIWPLFCTFLKTLYSHSVYVCTKFDYSNSKIRSLLYQKKQTMDRQSVRGRNVTPFKMAYLATFNEKVALYRAALETNQ